MATKEYFEALELLNSKDKENFIHAYDLLDDEQQVKFGEFLSRMPVLYGVARNVEEALEIVKDE